jgi:plasmid stabilization system protein ParE
MSYRHLIPSLAEADITGAALWYERQQSGLGEKFLLQVDAAIARVLENPLAYPVIRRRHEVRRVLTHQFPYRIFYSLERDMVVVHAVLHASRDERVLDERI